jgi:hypothetical protein
VLLRRRFRFRHSDERFSGRDENRLRQIHPTAIAPDCCRKQAQPLAGGKVDLDDLHELSDLDFLQVKPRDEPVVGETEGEAVDIVQRAPSPIHDQPPTRVTL